MNWYNNYNPSTSSIYRPKLFLFLVVLLCLKVLLLMLAKLSLLVLVMAKMVCMVYPLYVKARLNISGRTYCYKNRCGTNGRPAVRKQHVVNFQIVCIKLLTLLSYFKYAKFVQPKFAQKGRTNIVSTNDPQFLPLKVVLIFFVFAKP